MEDILLSAINNKISINFGICTAVPVNGSYTVTLPRAYTTTRYSVVATPALAVNDMRYYLIPYASRPNASQILLKIGRCVGNETGYLAVWFITIGY